jgi:hypothetical protein
MNLPSGVRAAETMTTGSEAAAMAGSSFFQSDFLHYDHHMMRRKNCNGNGG